MGVGARTPSQALVPFWIFSSFPWLGMSVCPYSGSLAFVTRMNSVSRVRPQDPPHTTGRGDGLEQSAHARTTRPVFWLICNLDDSPWSRTAKRASCCNSNQILQQSPQLSRANRAGVQPDLAICVVEGSLPLRRLPASCQNLFLPYTQSISPMRDGRKVLLSICFICLLKTLELKIEK